MSEQSAWRKVVSKCRARGVPPPDKTAWLAERKKRTEPPAPRGPVDYSAPYREAFAELDDDGGNVKYFLDLLQHHDERLAEALADTAEAKELDGTPIVDTFTEEEWLEEHTEEDRRAFIEESYSRDLKEAEKTVEDEIAAVRHMREYEAREEARRTANAALTLVAEALDYDEPDWKVRGHDSDYATLRPPRDEYGERPDEPESVEVRVSDHPQPPGGGFRRDESGEGRFGHSDLNVVVRSPEDVSVVIHLEPDEADGDYKSLDKWAVGELLAHHLGTKMSAVVAYGRRDEYRWIALEDWERARRGEVDLKDV